MLIAAGAKTDVTDKWFRTPLHVALLSHSQVNSYSSPWKWKWNCGVQFCQITQIRLWFCRVLESQAQQGHTAPVYQDWGRIRSVNNHAWNSRAKKEEKEEEIGTPQCTWHHTMPPCHQIIHWIYASWQIFCACKSHPRVFDAQFSLFFVPGLSYLPII